MELLKKMLFLSISIITLLSCDKKEPEPEDKKVPVEYFLSEEDKTLFNAFKNNMTLHFADSLNNTLDFQADSVYTVNTCWESNLDKGEALSVRYNCESNYFPNFSFNCRLTARPDAKSDLSIIFATGTFWNDKANDYNFSWFCLRPNDPQNLYTANYFGTDISQQFLDSAVLNNTTFYNVFFSMVSPSGASGFGPSKTQKCYYTVEQGVIAFKNDDGKLWVRQ